MPELDSDVKIRSGCVVQGLTTTIRGSNIAAPRQLVACCLSLHPLVMILLASGRMDDLVAA